MTFNQQQRLSRHYAALVTKFDARGPCGAKCPYPARGETRMHIEFVNGMFYNRQYNQYLATLTFSVTNCCSASHLFPYHCGNFMYEDLDPTPVQGNF